MISRGTILKATAAGFAISHIPTFGSASKTAQKTYKITVQAGEHLFYQVTEKSKLWLYNQSTHGRQITAVTGEVLEVTFVNQLDQPSTVLWHCVRGNNAMDGVPGLKQDTIAPGDRFTYRFPLRAAGTFWYDEHNNPWEQVTRGPYGALIVYEYGEISSQGDIALPVDDWRLDEKDKIHTTSLGSLHDWSHGGRNGNFLTVNSRSEAKLKIPGQGPVRMRFISAANARIIRFAVDNDLPMSVIAVEGATCAPFDVDEVVLEPAQRVDVFIYDTSDLTSLWEVSTSQRVIVASFVKENDLSPLASPTLNSQPCYEKPDAANVRQVDIHLQGGAMGNLMNAEFE